MTNPWIHLPKRPPFILDADRDAIRPFNLTKRKSSHRIQTGLSLPEPYIGNPNTASVILLNLNPGHKQSDQRWHRNKTFRKAVRQNLHHNLISYPFYPLHPKFADSPVAKWWRRSLGRLRREFNEQRLASKILAIEWFPYHSPNASLDYFEQSPLTSQKYSWHLARQALQNPKKVVVVGKGYPKWEKSLVSLKGVIRLKNTRGWCYVTPGNMRRGEFDRILKAIGS